MGDFNMIENKEDKSGGIPHTWKGNERLFWVNLKRNFNIIDPLAGLEKTYNDT